MKTRTMLVALVILPASILARAQTSPAASPPPSREQTPAQPPAPDFGKGSFTRLCSDCHDADRVTASRRSRTEWEEVLDTMVSKGATGSDEDFSNVLVYLLRNFGRVYINTSPAADLVSVLGLTPADAAAIVAYRKEHEKFADFDAVLKVPGIDVKMLQQQKDAVAF